MPNTIDESIRVWTLPKCDPELKDYFILSPFTDSDRATWRGYDRVYSHYLKHLRHEPINIMEVGLQSGYGALAWARYFNKANVYGMEIDKRWLDTYDDIYKTYPDVESRLHFLSPINSLKANSWSQFDDNYFDVIIDDGDHRCASMRATFDNSISKLKPGGWYFIEDLHLYTDWMVEGYLEHIEPIVIEYEATIYSHTNLSSRAKHSREVAAGRRTDWNIVDPEMINYIIAIQKS